MAALENLTKRVAVGTGICQVAVVDYRPWTWWPRVLVMTWYAKRFEGGKIRLSEHSGLEDFKEVFAAFAQRQPGAAVFVRLEDDGSAVVYLTPPAAEFAAMIRADEVEPPPPDSLSLLS
jgi:hypothetical protein